MSLVFELYRLLKYCQDYVTSSVIARDTRIRQKDRHLIGAVQLLWPKSLIQLLSAYSLDTTIDQLGCKGLRPSDDRSDLPLRRWLPLLSLQSSGPGNPSHYPRPERRCHLRQEFRLRDPYPRPGRSLPQGTSPPDIDHLSRERSGQLTVSYPPRTQAAVRTPHQPTVPAPPQPLCRRH